MKTLIVIDMQNDFVTGVLGTPEAVSIVPNVKKKVEDYLGTHDRVIFTRDTHYNNYERTLEGKHLPVKHCIARTDGWQIIPELIQYKNKVATKHAFGYTNWATDYFGLNSSDAIELVGLCTDICVVSNALILKSTFPEIEISVDASCCAGTTPENHKAALQVMKCCQINVVGE